MTIDWAAFLIVAVTTWVAAILIVSAYSFGVRLLAVARDDDRHEDLNRFGAFACFAFCGIVVLFGIILIVPALSASILGV
ncbi:hypothetical protein GcLGCM259_1713 [Glutamicibacter creatinolyticus]|uniref:Uncharacterized protein n=1 Tax=Glutamicibacter creatinolyticus TaxID=162496 RepID=A0A5B7WU71_9MICC|nr:hypothetical protein [Glutamicibacter creatinolyticus]QCY47437.1 hypothetical protein GcLGCM259_1713 [Glutamicibacter creatinolyticus]